MNLINVIRTGMSVGTAAAVAYFTRNTSTAVRVTFTCASALAAHLMGSSKLFLKKGKESTSSAPSRTPERAPRTEEPLNVE